MLSNSEGDSRHQGSRVWSEKVFPTSLKSLTEVLQKLLPVMSCCLVWNEKLMGSVPNVESWTMQMIDVFAEAPAEMRREHSLNLAPIRADVLPLDALFEILSSHAACLLFYRSDLAELLEAKALYWGWFLNPENLPVLFSEVEEELRLELAFGLEGLLVLNAERGCGLLYSWSSEVGSVVS